ncbi:MAG: DNA-formamidopyrimidine glycosylase [Opitutus sp.]|nr:DNA-formamidopyrimidine glycosylase [Opitutus sp.]
MPELAEVEFYRRRWSAGHGAKIVAVHVHERAKVYRNREAVHIAKALTGAKLLDSGTAAKQMLFRFSGGVWLGVHLGMSGELRVEPADYPPGKHDHLVLRQAKRSLVFSDPRMFGAVLLHEGKNPPDWWTKIAPAILSPAFTVKWVADFLARRGRAPIKAVLLMQERFPGVGNWMADEILWRAALHPARLASSLTPKEIKTLHRECRFVCRGALKYNAGVGGKMPSELNQFMPDSWLFNHRWEDGRRCPRTGALLRRDEIGGRTTCWSPAHQKPR